MLVGKKVMVLGAVLGGLAVLVGAFGAHALKPLLLENGRVATFELAVRYQFYHSLLLLVMGFLKGVQRVKTFPYAVLLIFAGLIAFSGSLYIFSLSNMTYWAIITPFGGVSLLAGWTLLVITLMRFKGDP